MVYGLIDQNNHQFYTYLDNVLPALGSAPEAYNWLVTDHYCNMSNAITRQIDRQGYCWLSGQELIRFAMQDNTQWIGGVFSGFEKDIPLEQVLAYPMPVWESESFWHTPLSLQHPLATVELVPWDSCYTLLLSKNKQLLDAYRQAYPTAQDLATYQSE